jgi:glycosyltransferase involved in cell wall biosynthesis
VALEAAERHTPVIVSNNAGVSEVLPSSIVVDFWDLHKMTETIVEILNNTAYRRQLVEQQLQELRHVTWQRAATRVNDIYRSVFMGSR